MEHDRTRPYPCPIFANERDTASQILPPSFLTNTLNVAKNGHKHEGASVYIKLAGSLPFTRRKAKGYKIVFMNETARLTSDWID